MAWIWIGFSIFLAFGIEAMTGFGSIVLALSLGALVMDLQSLVPILVPLNILMTAPLTYKYRQHIQVGLLLKGILPFMAAGTAIGVLLTPMLPGAWSKLIFAALIIWFAARALLKQQPPPMGSTKRNTTIGAAGITHGLFASGGPLLVYALARSNLDKTAFRATLLTVWLTLNSGLTIWFAINGQLWENSQQLLMLAPCVIVGAIVGNLLHHKIKQEAFLPMVFGLLLLVGIILTISSVSAVIN